MKKSIEQAITKTERLEEEIAAALMTAEQYSKIRHERPYIFVAEKGDKKIVYFGLKHSNGSAWIKVTEADKTLLEASGNFTVVAYDMRTKTYVPGDWEQKIPTMPQQARR